MRFMSALFLANFVFMCGTPVSAESTQESSAADLRSVTIDLWYMKMGEEADATAQELLTKTASPTGHGALGDRQEFIAGLSELQKQNRITSSYHLQATTLDHQKLTIQIGERKPRVRAVTRQRAGMVRTIEYEDVGMKVRATPEVVSDGRLIILVEFEESSPVETDVATMESSDGTQIETAGGVDSVVMETAVKVRTGYPRLLVGSAAQGSERPSGHLLVICATIGDE